MSAAEGLREGMNVVFELKEVPLVILDAPEEKFESPMTDASAQSSPAAAIICGLSGLLDELPKLPFLDRCMPLTMLVLL